MTDQHGDLVEWSQTERERHNVKERERERLSRAEKEEKRDRLEERGTQVSVSSHGHTERMREK